MRTIQDGTHVWALTDTVAGRAPAHQLADLIAIIEARSQATNRMPSPKTYFLTLVTTTACNLRCPYCFQNTAVAPGGGPGAVQRVPATFMTRATLSLALDWVASQMQASGASTLHLLLFGGEPLLKPPLCLAALRGSRSLGLTDASMVTNGVYLTPDLATQLEAAALTALQVTLDGPRSTHDNLRISVSTPETFDLIVSNVRACADQTSIGLTVRVNVTNAALDSLPHLLHDLARHLPPDRIRIDLVPVRTYQSPDGHHYADLDEPLITALSQATLLASTLGFEVPEPGDNHLCDFCRTVANPRGAVIAPDGRLYSCWETAGRSHQEVGTIRTGYYTDDRVKERWKSCPDCLPDTSSYLDWRTHWLDERDRLLLRARAGLENVHSTPGQ